MGPGQAPAWESSSVAFLWQSIAKYWRYCRTYGIGPATRLAWRRLRRPRGKPPLRVTPLAPTQAAVASVSPIEKTVSIIIPTRNAGDRIGLLIRKLKAQLGIKLAEIIVVDSGSTDQTLGLAQAGGARVLHISPQEFTHALARNRGAEAAGGDYLLFMVQDALPLTELWLWEMAKALQVNDVGAVSCAEYPRGDSDLFYQFLIHQQYDSPGLDRDRLLAWDNSCSTYLGLRANAQLSNIAALIRRDAFARYRYRTAYAEDVDLGVRMIRDGWKLGFLHSTRVLHSHNRPAHYFLQRGYTDVRYLPDVFPNFTYPEVDRRDKLYADMSYLRRRVASLNEALERLTFPQPLKSFLDSVRGLFCSADSGEPGALSDTELERLIRALCSAWDAQARSYAPARNVLLPHVMRHFEDFGAWLCAIYEETGQELARNIVSGIEKIFALHCGNHLAYVFLTAVGRGSLDESIRELDKRLRAGV